MTSVEVDIVLVHLAGAAAAPTEGRPAAQRHSHAGREDLALAMDNLTEMKNPNLATDTARLPPLASARVGSFAVGVEFAAATAPAGVSTD
jgi:hypothetical protein